MLFNGDVERSHTLQLQYLDLIKALFCDVNPIPVKQALACMGLDAGPCRRPLCEMEPAQVETLRAVLKKHRLLAGGMDERPPDALCRRASRL